MITAVANKEGLELNTYNKAVSLVAVAMAKIMEAPEKLVEDCGIAGMLVGIGKRSKVYQDWITNPDAKEEEDHGHALFHEVSYAILYRLLDRHEYRRVLYAIYWVEPKPVIQKSFKIRETFEEITKGIDIKPVERLFQLTNNDLGLKLSTREAAFRTPTFFREEKEGEDNSKCNAELLLVRGILISAKRFVEGLKREEVEGIVHGTFDYISCLRAVITANIGPYTLPDSYEKNRLDLQESCAKKCFLSDSNSFQIRSPAGYGKTIMGVMLASLIGNKKILWITPRNEVARSVYNQICKECEILGINCTIELYLTSQQKAFKVIGGPQTPIPEFSADIIVTNIDNNLFPIREDYVTERLFQVMASVHIYDEFHEFPQNPQIPMFFAFTLMMRLRNCLTNSKSMFLSATPTNMHILWEDEHHKTLILPDEKSHYPTVHSRDIDFHIIDNVPKTLTPASLTVLNSIRNAQQVHLSRKSTYLAHSNYTDNDKRIVMDHIIGKFGKSGDGVKLGETIVSAPIIQASLDISLVEVNVSFAYPEADIQRLGRLDRWLLPTVLNGSRPVFRMMDLGYNKSERGAISIIYPWKLRNKWVDFCKEKLEGRSTITLKEMYDLYNEFYLENGDEVLQWLKKCYSGGLKELIKFYPTQLIGGRRRSKKTKTTKNSKYGLNVFRGGLGSFYISAEIVKNGALTGKWLGTDLVINRGPKSKSRYTEKDKFINRAVMKIAYRILVNQGFVAHRKTLKDNIPISFDKLFKMAKNPQTPIPDIYRLYDLRRDPDKEAESIEEVGLGLIDRPEK